MACVQVALLATATPHSHDSIVSVVLHIVILFISYGGKRKGDR